MGEAGRKWEIMNSIRDYIKEYIEEFWRIRKDSKKDDLYLLETALFIEDVFGVRLSDDEITHHLLKDPVSIEHFIRSKVSTGKNGISGTGKKGV